MGVSQVAATNRNAQATKTKTIGRFSVQATVQKPKERQFQVVPVPCVFTRGRWKCWDFKIGTDVTSTPDILEFADKTSVTEKTLQTPTVLKTTTPIIESTHPQTVFTHTVTTCDLTASASDQRLCERDYKESSTIVVTSIEPAPLTPVHSNKESRGSDCADSPDGRRIIMTSSPTKHKPTCTFHNAGDLSTSDSGDSYESYGRATAYSNTGNVSPPPHNMSPPPVQINNNYGASLSRQQSINGFGNHDPSCIISPSHDIAIDDSSIMPQNNVAIDNKIEQAMDLVKNHLTYAVREEVDNMRSHIVELEGRVAELLSLLNSDKCASDKCALQVNELDRQNQFLRQFAPPEVLANLPMLSQQRMLPTVIPHIPITQQIPGLTMHQQQPMQHAATVPSRNTGAIAPQVASSAGGSPKGNTDHQQPSMIPKLNRPSGIPLPNSFFESSGVRRSPEP